MRGIIVEMNYDNKKKVPMEVPALATKSEVNVLVKKKFGNYDVKAWVEATPKAKKVEAPIVEVEEEPLF